MIVPSLRDLMQVPPLRSFAAPVGMTATFREGRRDDDGISQRPIGMTATLEEALIGITAASEYLGVRWEINNGPLGQKREEIRRSACTVGKSGMGATRD